MIQQTAGELADYANNYEFTAMTQFTDSIITVVCRYYSSTAENKYQINVSFNNDSQDVSIIDLEIINEKELKKRQMQHEKWLKENPMLPPPPPPPGE